jgi:hypothetical protein
VENMAKNLVINTLNAFFATVAVFTSLTIGSICFQINGIVKKISEDPIAWFMGPNNAQNLMEIIEKLNSILKKVSNEEDVKALKEILLFLGELSEELRGIEKKKPHTAVQIRKGIEDAQRILARLNDAPSIMRGVTDRTNGGVPFVSHFF